MIETSLETLDDLFSSSLFKGICIVVVVVFLRDRRYFNRFQHFQQLIFLIYYSLRRNLAIIRWVLKKQLRIYGVLIIVLVNPHFIIISHNFLMLAASLFRSSFKFPVFLEIERIEFTLQRRESLCVYDVSIWVDVVSGCDLWQSIIEGQSFLGGLEGVLVGK